MLAARANDVPAYVYFIVICLCSNYFDLIGQYISFKHEHDFRNYLVEAVMEWTSDFSQAV